MYTDPIPEIQQADSPEAIHQLFAVFDRIKLSALTRIPEESHTFLTTLLDDLNTDIRFLHENAENDTQQADFSTHQWVLIRKLEQVEELIDAFESYPDSQT